MIIVQSWAHAGSACTLLLTVKMDLVFIDKPYFCNEPEMHLIFHSQCSLTCMLVHIKNAKCIMHSHPHQLHCIFFSTIYFSVLADALVIGLFLTSKWAPLDWFYPVLLYIQVCLSCCGIIICTHRLLSVPSSMQVMPLTTFYFPHTFEIIQPYVSLSVSSFSTLCSFVTYHTGSLREQCPEFLLCL